MKTFAELLVELSRNKVKYILVGGLAVDLCGYSRVTHDVDIIIDYEKENINLLISILSNFGEGSAKELSYTDFDLEEGCIRIVEDFPLDIFTIMRSHTYQYLTRHLKFYEINEVKIPYLCAEGLIELKQKSYRAKDQQDVQTLKILLSNETNQIQIEKSGFVSSFKQWLNSFFHN